MTEERVRRVDLAERFLKEELNERELRVRHEANGLARVEVPLDAIAAVADERVRRRVLDRLQSLGFKYVTLDLAGFRSGSMNDVVPLTTLMPRTAE